VENLSHDQSLKLLKELKEKAENVEWYNTGRKEHYGIITKRIENKEKLREQSFLFYDLDDRGT